MAEQEAGAIPETVVLLHGFAGTRHMWDPVVAHLDAQRYRPLALDLPGHGEAASDPGPITLQHCADAVLEATPPSCILCGYSLGGRIALRLALEAPERVARLVLVSSTPGIQDRAQRAQRRAADEALAERLERSSLEEFIAHWNAGPLFSSDPIEVTERAREDQRRNDPRALAEVLRGVGTGAMEPLWRRMSELTLPVVVVAGTRDGKFKAIARRMVAHMPNATLLIAAGGHRVPLEAPGAVLDALTLGES